MLSGLHRVTSIFCGVCDNDRAIGWKYVNFGSYRSKHTSHNRSINKEGTYWSGISLKRRTLTLEMMRIVTENSLKVKLFDN